MQLRNRGFSRKCGGGGVMIDDRGFTVSHKMNAKAIFGLVALVTLGFGAGAARAAWPERVFAPYMYIGAGDDFKLTDCYAGCGQKYYTLAFFIARQDRSRDGGTIYYKEPAWDGATPLAKNLYADQIDAIRKAGGDVIVSFGGEGGKELAFVEDNPLALQADYQAIMDRYKFTWLDFDIEGDSLDMKLAGNAVRNTVLAELQKKNPGLRISFTLPVDPNGISDSAQALLKDALAKGVKIYSADVMVMFFGERFIHKGKSEGQLGIDSAIKAHEQIAQIDQNIRIGLCPCLGKNGSTSEIFTIDDAKVLRSFADKTPWICSLHFWSINADAARPSKRDRPATQPMAEKSPWEFANVFKSFTTGK
jgi:hypothetical protein